MALIDIDEIDQPRSRTNGRQTADPATRNSARAIELDDEEDAQFLRTEKRVPVRRSPIPKKAQNRLKQALAVVITVLVLCCLAIATYRYALTSARFRIKSRDDVEVTGVHNASRAQVMDVVAHDIDHNANVFSVPLDEREKQLEKIPWVESASVMRLLPNRLAINIRERTPVAFVQIGPRTGMIDAEGVVMGMPASRQNRYSFPVVRGITESEPLSSRAAAMKIYNRFVAELDSEGTHYSRGLSEVDLSDPENVKVIANDSAGAVQIFLGSSDFLPRFKLYVAHVSEWRQQFSNLQSVDLRYDGQIIVNPDSARPAKATPPAASVPPQKTEAATAPAVKPTAAKARRHRHRRR